MLLFGMNGHEECALLFRVAFAMLLGGAIGFEREKVERPAGLRTHMLVAGAGALIYGLVALLLQEMNDSSAPSWIRADPVRVTEALVTGISFLGAGTIFVSGRRERVQGLTTAASLLISGCIGLAIGMRHYVAAAGVTLLVLFVLHGVRRFEKALALK
jgi:putative Mg2+ transporter-C (MgtC) family protein